MTHNFHLTEKPPTSQSGALRSQFSIALLLAISFASYVLLGVLQGRFAVTDEVVFKSAGRNWASTGSFSAPELPGFLQGLNQGPPVTEIYLAQPPGYTFLFGLFTRLVGFGPQQCILYDALIHILLAFTTGATALIVMKLPFRWAAAVAALILPLGTVGRPDELAMILGLAGTLVWLTPFKLNIRALLSGAVYGLCAATSIGAALLLAIATAGIALQQVEGFRERVRVVLLWCAAGAIAVASCIAPILAGHPDAWRQYVSHAGVQSNVLNHMVNASPTLPPDQRFPENDYGVESFKIQLIHGSNKLFLLAGCYVTALFCFARRRPTLTDLKSYWIGPTVALALQFILLPTKFTYFWFIGPWLLASTAKIAHSSWPSLSNARRAGLVFISLAFYFVAAFPYLKETAIIATLPPGQRFQENFAAVRAAVPSGAKVMTDESFWWFLADRCHVYDPFFSMPPASSLDYMVLSGNGSGEAGKPHPFSPFNDKARTSNFAVVENNLNPHSTRLLGAKLNSGWGFGALILRRR